MSYTCKGVEKFEVSMKFFSIVININVKGHDTETKTEYSVRLHMAKSAKILTAKHWSNK